MSYNNTIIELYNLESSITSGWHSAVKNSDLHMVRMMVYEQFTTEQAIELLELMYKQGYTCLGYNDYGKNYPMRKIIWIQKPLGKQLWIGFNSGVGTDILAKIFKL